MVVLSVMKKVENLMISVLNKISQKSICFLLIFILISFLYIPAFASENEANAITQSSASNEQQADNKDAEKDEKKRFQSNLVVTGYKVYSSGNNSTVASVHRGQNINVVVSLKNTGIKTNEIGDKNNLVITKPVDSFRFEGTPEVKITSAPEEDLAFTISFNKLSYNGTGNLLQFIVSYPAISVPYDTLEIKILECVEHTKKDSLASNRETGEVIPPMLQIYRSEPKEPVNPKEKVKTKITLKNLSNDTDIENIQINFETSDALVILDQSTSHKMSSLGKRKSSDIDLLLEAAPEISFGAQYITATIKYEFIADGERKRETLTEKVIIPTTPSEKKDDKKISQATPNVVISKYDFGDQVAVGDTFNLQIEFKNTSPNLPVENMIMLLETGESLSIEGSSNSFYIASLPAGATQTKQLQVLSLAKEAAAGNKIDVSFKYEFVDNEERKQVTISEKLSIPVFQPDRFQISQPVIPEKIYTNQELIITLPYVNKGRTDVYNIEAIYEGAMESLTRHQNLGNFEAGKSGTIDFILTPDKAGTFDFKIKVIYEDIKMKSKELEFPIKIKVTEPAEESAPDDLDSFSDEQPTPNKNIIYILPIIFFLVIVLIITAHKIKSRKKNSSKYSIKALFDEETSSENENK